MTATRRFYALIGATAALALGSAVAGAQTDTSSEGGEPGTARAEQLTIAISGFENNLTPYSTTNQSGITPNLLGMVYDSLFYSANQADPEPWLAEDFEVSEDGRTWTIAIRDGIRWHDGRPLTAEDVVFTYDYFFDSQQGRYSHHVNDVPFLERRDLVDEDTVRFTCREPCPTFDIDPGDLPILPKHIFEDVEDPATFTEELPVGSGPYELTRSEPDELYVFEANEEYFKGRPLVDRIEMPIVSQSSSMFLALRTGEVDAVSRIVPPQSVGSLQNAGLTIVEPPDYSSTQINFNTQRPPFDRTEFRNALNLAVETAPITETLLGDRGKPGVESYVDPDVPFAETSLEDKHDPARARQLLDELGFADGDGDGVRENERGEALSFEIQVSAEEAREIRAAELVRTQLADVGVQAEVLPLDPVTLSARRQPPNAEEVDVPETTRTGDYDMYVSSYGPHYLFDPDGLLYAFHCPGETGFGAYTTGYCNERFDRLVEEASTLGFEERTPLLQEAQRVLYDDPPTMPLYYPSATHAVDADAFNGWKPEAGWGVVHKRSFLPGARDTEQAAVTDEGAGGSSTLPVALIVLAVLALVGGGLLLRRRRRPAGDGVQGPEID